MKQEDTGPHLLDLCWAPSFDSHWLHNLWQIMWPFQTRVSFFLFKTGLIQFVLLPQKAAINVLLLFIKIVWYACPIDTWYCHSHHRRRIEHTATFCLCLSFHGTVSDHYLTSLLLTVKHLLTVHVCWNVPIPGSGWQQKQKWLCQFYKLKGRLPPFVTGLIQSQQNPG